MLYQHKDRGGAAESLLGPLILHTTSFLLPLHPNVFSALLYCRSQNQPTFGNCNTNILRTKCQNRLLVVGGFDREQIAPLDEPLSFPTSHTLLNKSDLRDPPCDLSVGVLFLPFCYLWRT
jgi:hypothetical protein